MNDHQENYGHHRQEFRQLARKIAARKILFKNNTIGMSVTWPTAVFSKI